MHFAKWFADQEHGALSRIKRATGLSYGTVHAICTGKRPPNYASALAISLATGEAVSVAEVYAIHKLYLALQPAKPTRAVKRKRAAAPRKRKPKAKRKRAALTGKRKRVGKVTKLAKARRRARTVRVAA